MNLIIDIGNTLSKAAIMDGNDIIDKKILDSNNPEHIIEYSKKFKIDSGILSSVKPYNPILFNYLNDNYYFIEMSKETELPIKNRYKTPETLGYDRIAAAIGGKLYYTDKNVLVINAGTCITFDFINKDNEYVGGSISPGIYMRLKSLNLLTAKLPLIEPDKNFDTLTGTNTIDSILSGVMNGIIYEIEGQYSRYKEKYQNFKAILSGGDSIFIETKLKNPIFAVQDIVLIGLNIILEYNKKLKRK